jgi:hypothetical protein
VAKFKGVRPGDVIRVQTKAESGFALVTKVDDDGVSYRPVPNSFQRREQRPKLRATEIREVYKHLKSR